MIILFIFQTNVDSVQTMLNFGMQFPLKRYWVNARYCHIMKTFCNITKKQNKNKQTNKNNYSFIAVLYISYAPISLFYNKQIRN